METNSEKRRSLVEVCELLQDRNTALTRRLEALRKQCQGNEPEDYIAHMDRENKELRESRGRDIYHTAV